MADDSKKGLMDSLGDLIPEGAKKFGHDVNTLRDVASHVVGKPVLEGFDSIARAIHHMTQAPNEDELYGRTYNLLRKYGHEQETAADLADQYTQQRIIHGMPLQMLGSVAADTIQRYANPKDPSSGYANLSNDALTTLSLPGMAAGALNTLVSTPANSGEDEVARQMRLGLRQSPQGMAETPVTDDNASGYDNGGAVNKIKSSYSDPKTEHIDDWKWRPLEDVKDELQLTEIPSHVHEFGKFMDRTAERAGREGLTPRDLIKAYTITRASIQRRATPAAKLQKSGLVLPQNVTGMVRPEGAFGHWLHTPAGQSYLDAAVKGQVHEGAVADAVKRMAPFGRHTTDIPDALRWAAANLPNNTSAVSHLVAAGRENASSPQEWRNFISKIRGVGPSKAGFLASLMGRGDQPTLDARQIKLHTDRPSAEAAKYISRKGNKGGAEAVDRLAARQSAMNLKTPENMKPYYQHLTHHAVWDKAGNEETTHQDVIDALQHAATGGSIMDHPLAQVMRALHPKGYDRGGSPTSRMGHNNPPSPISDDPKFREYMSMILDPRNPEHFERAKKIAESYNIGDLSYSGFKQHPLLPSQVKTQITDIPGASPVPENRMSWHDFYRIGKGGTLFTLGGDRSNLGRLTHINGKKLAWPIDLHAGTKYQREPNKGAVWANAKSAQSTLFNNVMEEAKKGKRVFGAFAPMNVTAIDSSVNMTDAMMSHIAASNIDSNAIDEFDELIRKGQHVYNGTPGDPAKKKAAQLKKLEIMKQWPGLRDPWAARNFAIENMAGTDRSAMIKMMDKKNLLDAGFPSVGNTRAAITDPDLLHTANNMVGGNIVELYPEKYDRNNLSFEHSTYNGPAAGKYQATVPYMPRHDVMPSFNKEQLMAPKYLQKKGKNAGQPLLVHPFSPVTTGRSVYRGNSEMRQAGQPIDEQMLESIEQGQDRIKKYGFKQGGGVNSNCDHYASEHFANGGEADIPAKTVKAYKLFRTDPRRPGQLFPLFVDANTPVPMNKWVKASAGPAGKDPTKVKSKLGDLAYRPGWHAGDLPVATHIGEKSDPRLKAPDMRPANHSWAEIEMPNDVDWQSIANKRMEYSKAGKPKLATAHITDQVPHGGHYRYKTNPNMTGNWLIGGEMKVNRILNDDEVKKINDAHGVSDLPRAKERAWGGRTGFDEGGEATGSVEPQENAVVPAPVQVAQLDQPTQQVQQTADQGPQWKTWFGYTPTQTDYDKMLKLSLGEAGVNTYDQYRGIYEATGNRLASGAYGGKSFADLITPQQMSGITRTDAINDLMTSNDPTKQKAYQTAQQALNDYLTEGQNKVLTTQTDWRGFQNGKPSPGTDFENKYVPGGSESPYQYNTFYDAYQNPNVSDKLSGLLADKNGIYTYNPYTSTYAQDVLSKENQLASAEDNGPMFTQQAALDLSSQQDAINAAQQAAVNQAQNFDTGIVQNAATDFNYLNPLQGTGIGDFTNMYTGVDYTNPTVDTSTPSLTDYSYNAFDNSSPWSFAVGGAAPYVPPNKDSWTDRTNKELQKEVLSPEKENEASEYYQKWQRDGSPKQRAMFTHGGYVYNDVIQHALRVAQQFGPDAAQRAVQIALQQAGRR